MTLIATTVHSVPLGEVELRWAPPEERTSGQALSLSEIAGYRIYYGLEPETEIGVVEIDDPQQTKVTIKGLETGENYYFTITAIDEAGRESPRSEPVEVTATR